MYRSHNKTHFSFTAHMTQYRFFATTATSTTTTSTQSQALVTYDKQNDT